MWFNIVLPIFYGIWTKHKLDSQNIITIWNTLIKIRKEPLENTIKRVNDITKAIQESIKGKCEIKIEADFWKERRAYPNELHGAIMKKQQSSSALQGRDAGRKDIVSFDIHLILFHPIWL